MRRRSIKSQLKYQGLPLELVGILMELRIDRGAGTVNVAVKCVDINWNTDSEGRLLGYS